MPRQVSGTTARCRCKGRQAGPHSPPRPTALLGLGQAGPCEEGVVPIVGPWHCPEAPNRCPFPGPSLVALGMAHVQHTPIDLPHGLTHHRRHTQDTHTKRRRSLHRDARALSCCGALQLRSQALKRRPSSSCTDPLPPLSAPFLHYPLRASCYCHTTSRLLSRLGSCLRMYTGSLTLQAFSCAGGNGVQWRTLWRIFDFQLVEPTIQPA
jgi:hypothetical protein